MLARLLTKTLKNDVIMPEFLWVHLKVPLFFRNAGQSPVIFISLVLRVLGIHDISDLKDFRSGAQKLAFLT